MKVKITIGDWSRDGHEEYDEFVFESNKPVEEIRQAYKDSCKLTNVSFNNNGSQAENYTSEQLDWQHPEHDDKHICVEYESNTISKLAHDRLGNFGIDTNDYTNENSQIIVDQFLQLIIAFIKLSLSDLELEEAAFKKSELRDIPAVNGWWNDELNVAWGYGLFY